MTPIDQVKAIESLGSEALFHKTAKDLCSQLPHMLELLAQAIDEGNESVTREKAHWIKGGLVYLHAGPSAEAAVRLEKATKLGRTELRLAFSDLETEIDRLRAFLSNL